jgi:hypothetical protein
MSLLPGAARAKHKQPRAKHDWYTENRWAAEQLFAQIQFTGPIHDPACGEGRIPIAARKAGYTATGADIVDRGFPGVEIVDFQTDRRPRTTLVFNAPYEKNEEFIAHALEVASHAVAAIVRIPFLCGQERFRDLYRPSPPSLALACSQRVNMPPGGIGAPEEGGTADYAWLIWSRTQPRWRRNGGSLPAPKGWWHSPDGTIFDWLEPLSRSRSRQMARKYKRRNN